MDRQSNREKWRERVQRWKDGGLTAQQYASETGLNYHTLMYWSARLKRDETGTNSTTKLETAPEFIEVTETITKEKTVLAKSGFELLISDVLIKVPVGVDEQTLRRVLTVIRQP